MSDEIDEELEDRLESISYPYLLVATGVIVTYALGFKFGVVMLVGFVVFDRVMAKHATGNWLGEPKDVNSEENESDDENLSLAEKLREERTYPPTKEVPPRKESSEAGDNYED